MTSTEQAQAAVDSFLDMWATGMTFSPAEHPSDWPAAGRRAPVLRHPGEVGLEFEEAFFPSMDGVPLEGWFILADSDKLIIHNHFLPGNRYGYPGHLPEFGGLGGFEVNFLPEYKALHDAGYNILCYDIRNFGLSGAANGSTTGIGLLEYRDVIGSIRLGTVRQVPARHCPDDHLPAQRVPGRGLNMRRRGQAPGRVRAHPLAHPAAAGVSKARHRGVRQSRQHHRRYARFDTALAERTGCHLDEQSPLEYARSIRIPTLVAQVHHDSMARPEDVQSIYDAIPADDKKLVWITTQLAGDLIPPSFWARPGGYAPFRALIAQE